MGATTFEDTAKGKTMAEAFANAVSQAQWEHGHGGYSGTIAEKGSFVELKVPGVEPKTLIEWLAMAEDDGYKRYELEDWQRYHSKNLGPDGLPVVPPPAPIPPRPWDSNPTAKRALERAMEAYHDKWGPAVGIQLEDGLYLFCGYASC